MATSLGFVPLTAPSFIGKRPFAPGRTARTPLRAPLTAVLDTPAGNTYMKRVSQEAVKDYLTRRAVRTVLYYQAELAQSPEKNWLEQFDQFSTKDKNGSFVDGDAFLDKMLHSSKVKGFITIGHPKGRFSRKFPFTIDPHRIASSILASRRQLSAEWATDLGCIAAENLEIQRMCFEKLLCADEATLTSKRNLIFDSDPFTSDHTPLRFNNYASLKVLITQHAIGRLQPYLRDTSNYEYMFLLEFVASYGSLTDGDDFIWKLMESPVQSRANPKCVVRPRAIAMQIMDLRKVIADEWIEVMQQVPDAELSRARDMLEQAAKMSSDFGEGSQ